MSNTSKTIAQFLLASVKQIWPWFVAALCLVWVFHDIRPDRLFDLAFHINWWWIALGIALDVASYAAQGLRWQLLLSRDGNITVTKATQAIYAGLFANEILPLRPGELVRTWLVSRWMNRSFTGILSTLGVERFFDAIWLAAGIGIMAFFVPLPQAITSAAKILGMISIICIAIFAVLVLSRERSNTNKSTNAISKVLETFASSIRAIGFSSGFFLSLLGSALILVAQALSFWCIMAACGIHIGVLPAAAVLLIVHLGTTIPNAPSNIGSFQFFCVLGLSLFGIDKTTAGGFSILVFVVLTAPLWLLGFFALSQSGNAITGIREEISKLTEHPKDKS